MKKLMSIFAALVLVAACGKNGVPAGDTKADGVSVGNGFRLQMTADLSDAVSLTTTVGESKRLIKVTSGRKFAEVLSGPHEITSWKETPTHIVAAAAISEGNVTCSLIAIPKVRGKSQVLCLRHGVYAKGTYDYDVHGSEVYFTHTTRPETKIYTSEWSYSTKYNRVTELRHWDGKSEEVETIYHADVDFNKSPAINSVFASETNDNLCFSLADESWSDGVDTGATRGHLFCRNGADAPWAKMDVDRVPEPSLKFGNTILIDNRGYEGVKFDLATFKKLERKGPLPMTRDFDIANGGFMGRGDWRSVMGILICVDKDGNGSQLAEVNAKTSLVRIGDWAWFFGSQTLRRVSLTSCTLDPKDYFESTTLIQISSLDWALGDFVRLDGTNGRGMPTTVHLTPTGSLIRLETERVKVSHPIDLKWDM